MIWKYPNHTLQTNQWNPEDPSANINHKTPGRQTKQSKATSTLFPIKMVVKLGRTQSNA